MPREIKFKGKRLDNGEWVCGYYLKDISGNSYIITEAVGNISCCSDCGMQDMTIYQVIPETVGEYAGFIDKYGVDIYEGAKLHIEITDFSTGKVIISADEIVEFCNGCFGVIWGSHREFKRLSGFSNSNTIFEVIGEAVPDAKA